MGCTGAAARTPDLVPAQSFTVRVQSAERPHPPSKTKLVSGFRFRWLASFLRNFSGSSAELPGYPMAALAMGCSAAEIVQVIRRVSSLGMHSCMVGFPILYSELEAAGKLEV